jgi:hypothetical protein
MYVQVKVRVRVSIHGMHSRAARVILTFRVGIHVMHSAAVRDT